MAANSRFAVATHILASMAVHQLKKGEGVPVPSQYLASSVNTSPVLIRRIIGQLKEAGLVKALHGRAGGAFLAKKADKINLYDIYRAVDEARLFAPNCNLPNANCPVSVQMGEILTPVFISSEKTIEKHLKKIKLSTVVRKIK